MRTLFEYFIVKLFRSRVFRRELHMAMQARIADAPNLRAFQASLDRQLGAYFNERNTGV